MIIKKSQIRASNWAIDNILEDVRLASPTHNQQFEIADYESKTEDVYLESIPKEFNLKPEFIFSRIE